MSEFCCNVNYSMNRRDFLGRFGLGLGGVALMGLLHRDAHAAPPATPPPNPFKGILDKPHFAPRAKRIIYLFMAGGPSPLDLFDHKPLLNTRNGEDLPESVRMGQRLTGMSGNQATLPLAGSIFKFANHGKCGAPVSELMPWTAKMVDELCFIKSLHTEAITTTRRSRSSRPATSSRAGRAWARGSATAWAARTRTCPASSS